MSATAELFKYRRKGGSFGRIRKSDVKIREEVLPSQKIKSYSQPSRKAYSCFKCYVSNLYRQFMQVDWYKASISNHRIDQFPFGVVYAKHFGLFKVKDREPCSRINMSLNRIPSSLSIDLHRYYWMKQSSIDNIRESYRVHVKSSGRGMGNEVRIALGCLVLALLTNSLVSSPIKGSFSAITRNFPPYLSTNFVIFFFSHSWLFSILFFLLGIFITSKNKYTIRRPRSQVDSKPTPITKPYLRLTAVLLIAAFVITQCGLGTGYADNQLCNLRIKQGVIDGETIGETADAIGRALGAQEGADGRADGGMVNWRNISTQDKSKIEIFLFDSEIRGMLHGVTSNPALSLTIVCLDADDGTYAGAAIQASWLGYGIKLRPKFLKLIDENPQKAISVLQHEAGHIAVMVDGHVHPEIVEILNQSIGAQSGFVEPLCNVLADYEVVRWQLEGGFNISAMHYLENSIEVAGGIVQTLRDTHPDDLPLQIMLSYVESYISAPLAFKHISHPEVENFIQQLDEQYRDVLTETQLEEIRKLVDDTVGTGLQNYRWQEVEGFIEIHNAIIYGVSDLAEISGSAIGKLSKQVVPVSTNAGRIRTARPVEQLVTEGTEKTIHKTASYAYAIGNIVLTAYVGAGNFSFNNVVMEALKKVFDEGKAIIYSDIVSIQPDEFFGGATSEIAE